MQFYYPKEDNTSFIAVKFFHREDETTFLLFALIYYLQYKLKSTVQYCFIGSRVEFLQSTNWHDGAVIVGNCVLNIFHQCWKTMEHWQLKGYTLSGSGLKTGFREPALFVFFALVCPLVVCVIRWNPFLGCHLAVDLALDFRPATHTNRASPWSKWCRKGYWALYYYRYHKWWKNWASFHTF